MKPQRLIAGGRVLQGMLKREVLWLKFGGPSGLTWWFWAKLALVVVALIGVGLHERAGRRFRKGDESVVPLMFIGGRAAGIGILLAMLCAVFTFK